MGAHRIGRAGEGTDQLPHHPRLDQRGHIMPRGRLAALLADPGAVERHAAGDDLAAWLAETRAHPTASTVSAWAFTVGLASLAASAVLGGLTLRAKSENAAG